MIEVNREQAIEIRKRLPYENVTVCNKQAPSRKKSYYVAESYSVLKLLQEMKSKQKIQHFE